MTSKEFKVIAVASRPSVQDVYSMMLLDRDGHMVMAGAAPPYVREQGEIVRVPVVCGKLLFDSLHLGSIDHMAQSLPLETTLRMWGDDFVKASTPLQRDD